MLALIMFKVKQAQSCILEEFQPALWFGGMTEGNLNKSN
jgi:hypothetical protein